eukprot:1673193-Rhodomonas_salina.2
MPNLVMQFGILGGGGHFSNMYFLALAGRCVPRRNNTACFFLLSADRYPWSPRGRVCTSKVLAADFFQAKGDKCKVPRSLKNQDGGFQPQAACVDRRPSCSVYYAELERRACVLVRSTSNHKPSSFWETHSSISTQAAQTHPRTNHVLGGGCSIISQKILWVEYDVLCNASPTSGGFTDRNSAGSHRCDWLGSCRSTPQPADSHDYEIHCTDITHDVTRAGNGDHAGEKVAFLLCVLGDVGV